MANVPVEVLRVTKEQLNVANRTAVDVENSLKRNVENAEAAIIVHRKREEAINQQMYLFVVLLDKLTHWKQTLQAKSVPVARVPTPRDQVDQLNAQFVQPVSVARDRELSSVQRAMAFAQASIEKIMALRERLQTILTRIRGEISTLTEIGRRDTHAFTITLGRNAGRKEHDTSGGSPRPPPKTPDFNAAYLPFLNSSGAQDAAVSAAILSGSRGSTPRKGTSLQGSTLGGSDFALSWESKVASTAAKTFNALRDSGELERTIHEDWRRLQAECNLQHNVAVNTMNTAIDNRNSNRNAVIGVIRNVEHRVFELRKEWRNISDAALAMREPLMTVAVRQGMRDVEDDGVTSKLNIQREETTEARNQVKKRCKKLHDEVKQLEAVYLAKQVELAAIDGIRASVSAAGPEPPINHHLMTLVPLTQKSPRCESIRTFPEQKGITRPFAVGPDGEMATKIKARQFWPLLNVDGPAMECLKIPQPPKRT